MQVSGVQWLGQLPIFDRAIWPAFARRLRASVGSSRAIGVQNIRQGNVGDFLSLATGLVVICWNLICNRSAIASSAAAGCGTPMYLHCAGRGSIVAICALARPTSNALAHCAIVAIVAIVVELLLFVPTITSPTEEPMHPGWMGLLADQKRRIGSLASIAFSIQTPPALGNSRHSNSRCVERHRIDLRSLFHHAVICRQV
jgi:hypothetical protein